ncbi:MAG: hypothetical protein IGS48_02935 [Oscillatoriales cyanobacterium C42_A2020_001]|nr:hypothetical protein [Leptolyngbyaceae cyanobacterium C42_A2020_001]
MLKVSLAKLGCTRISSNCVKEAILRLEQSKQLLEIAKTEVEQAVETDEITATIWINELLEALGINLSNSN